MAAISFAFSVHHFVSSVGADAGFAAIIGLAILVLLYFAQARETASLREQAYESEQRVQQLEGRLAHLARTQVPAAPGTAAGQQRPPVAPPPAAARAAANPVPSAVVGAAPAAAAGAGAPGPPAGMGAPALSAATKLIPTAGAQAGASSASGGPTAPGPATVAAGAGAGASGPGASGATPGPATVAAAGASARSQTEDQPDDLTVVGSPAVEADTNGSGGEPAVAAATPPQARQARPPAGVRSGPYDHSVRQPPPLRSVRGGDQPRSRARRILPLLIGVAAVAAIVVVLLALTAGGTSNKSTQTSSAANSNAPTPHHRAKPAAFTPSSVTVAVLNGTATSGLARRVAAKLTGSGYKQGTVATATDQTRTATVVAYLPGHKRDALAVASALKLGSASVQSIDPNTQAVACPPGTACAAGVVVTVGSDVSNLQ